MTLRQADRTPGGSRMRSPAKNDWRSLWSATAVSTLGDGAFLAVLPLLAATMTTDPRLIAGVTAWGTLPWLLAALPAGALIDRMDARRTLIWVQLAQALMVAGLAVLSLMHAGGLAAIYLVAFGVGVAETMAKVALQKMLPAIVPSERLEAANGRQNAVIFSAKEFAGPPLGVFLLTISTPLPLWLNVVSFGVSALLIARIRATAPGNDSAKRDLRREIAEGLRWLIQNRLLRTLAIASGVANLANFIALSTLVLFATQRLGISNASYGLLIGLMAVGGIAGSLMAQRIVAGFGGRKVASVTIFATPAALLGVYFLAYNMWVLIGLVTVTSFSASLWNVATGSLRQRTVPAAMLGRVSSAGLLIAWGSQPIGAILGGVIAAQFGLAAPWLIAGVLRLGAAILVRPVLQKEWRD